LVVLGTTAENATLSQEEKELVIQTVVITNNGRLPLVLGVGGNNLYGMDLRHLGLGGYHLNF
jgi:4-hydroxy-tetrahydrodipicolinate synthase